MNVEDKKANKKFNTSNIVDSANVSTWNINSAASMMETHSIK